MLPDPSIRPWSLEGAQVVGRYRIFDVTRNNVRDGSGSERGEAFTFQMPDWCTVVPVTPDGHILLVRQWRFGTQRFEIETPGGVIDAGESAEAAARRELLEEAGAVAHALRAVGVVAANPALQNNVCHLFVAEGVEEGRSTSFDPLEELETLRVSPSELETLLDDGIVRHSLAVVALERYLRMRNTIR